LKILRYETKCFESFLVFWYKIVWGVSNRRELGVFKGWIQRLQEVIQGGSPNCKNLKLEIAWQWKNLVLILHKHLV
jgi:hypothetical protein